VIELPAEDFASANSLLDELDAGAEIAGAVLSGHTKGKVFLRTPADPGIGFVYDNGFCVLAGPVADLEFAKACLNWLYRRAEQDFFILYPGHECWLPILDAVVAAPVKKVGRIDYQLDARRFAAQRFRQALPRDFTLARMDAALMRTAADTLYPWARGTWKSEMHFERDGLGFCVLTQGRIASLCYSIFASGSRREIDILTVKPYKRQGLAKAAASAYIQECLDRGLQPGWDCFKDNHASGQLAEVLGFIPKNEFPVYSWQRARKAGDAV
jgi:RimJ/RimL family protein N-acetyltransferase